MSDELQLSEIAANSITFNLEKRIGELSPSDSDLIIFGEVHNEPSKFESVSKRLHAESVVDIIKTLPEKPSFIAVDLTTLNKEDLNENGKAYFRDIKPLLDFAKENSIEVVAAAGPSEEQQGTQKFEDAIAQKLSEAIKTHGAGVAFLGKLHARKQRTTGKFVLDAAASVLEDEDLNVTSFIVHSVKYNEPGAEEINKNGRMAIQNASFASLYPSNEVIQESIDLYYGEEQSTDFDAIFLLPSTPDKLERW